MTDPLTNLRAVLDLLATDPLRAADHLDAMADRLRQQALAIREQARQATPENPYKVPGGMADVVKMQVRGPGGELKQSIDTSRN